MLLHGAVAPDPALGWACGPGRHVGACRTRIAGAKARRASWSASLEPRRPLLQEGVHAFGVVVRRTERALQVALELELRIEGVRVRRMDRSLDRRERAR